VSRDELRATVLRVLGEIAPEADLAALHPDVGFVVGLHAALGVDIPEADYPKLATLDACVDYLDARRIR
jgi:hypothetical protein